MTESACTFLILQRLDWTRLASLISHDKFPEIEERKSDESEQMNQCKGKKKTMFLPMYVRVHLSLPPSASQPARPNEEKMRKKGHVRRVKKLKINSEINKRDVAIWPG